MHNILRRSAFTVVSSQTKYSVLHSASRQILHRQFSREGTRCQEQPQTWPISERAWITCHWKTIILHYRTSNLFQFMLQVCITVECSCKKSWEGNILFTDTKMAACTDFVPEIRLLKNTISHKVLTHLAPHLTTERPSDHLAFDTTTLSEHTENVRAKNVTFRSSILFHILWWSIPTSPLKHIFMGLQFIREWR